MEINSYMRIDEVAPSKLNVDKVVNEFKDFFDVCREILKIDQFPPFRWVGDGSHHKKHHSFGSFQMDTNEITVEISNRHPIDIMRTLAHELVHYKQKLDGRINPDSGETGSEIENEANAVAGVIMREFDRRYPEAFDFAPVSKDIREDNVNKDPQVYVDMDGVIADLFKYIAIHYKVNHYKEVSDELMQKFFKDANAEKLFASLPKFATADHLTQGLTKIAGGYNICSSPLQFDKEGSIRGKKVWLQKNLKSKPMREFFTHDKAQYATQPDGTPNILIDDYKKNINAWNAAGGIGIRFKAESMDVNAVLKEVEAAFAKKPAEL
jgi:hypothetical protein